MGSVKKNLIAAKGVLSDPKNWRQDGFLWGDGCFCVLGAVGSVVFDNIFDNPSTIALIKASGKENWIEVAIWNDYTSTTHADVMALFDRAIAAQDDAP